MTALDLDFLRKTTGKGTSEGRPPAYSLDRMTALQLARRTVIFTVDAGGIAELVDAAREDIPGLTSNRMFQTVANHGQSRSGTGSILPRPRGRVSWRCCR